MTRNDFEAAFLKIIGQFGSKTYSQDRVNLIYDEVKNITSADFERLVTYFIANSRMSPMVVDFRKAIGELGIKKQFTSQRVEHHQVQVGNGSNGVDWEYPVQKGIWANSKYFFIREDGQHRFIIKEMCENNELLEADKEAAKKWIPFWEKITHPRYKGELGTYSEHFQKAIKTYG